MQIVRTRRWAAGLAIAAAVAVLPACGGGDGGGDQQAGADDTSVAIQWNQAALQAVAPSKIAPPQVSRALAIIHTCVYDAWAAYDDVAVGTQLGGALRQPAGERSLGNRNEAVSYAAYTAAVDVFPASKDPVFVPLMQQLGYDPAQVGDRSTPSGVGATACQAVLDERHHDGSNQLGDMPGGKPGVPYSDYTGFKPVNAPMDLRRNFDPATVKDVNKWQPLTYVDASGAVVTPPFVAPFWNQVEPFSLDPGARYGSRTGPPSAAGPDFRAQAQELLDMSAGLDDHKKAVVEYWADGAGSTTPPGHWNQIAQFVSARDDHGADDEGLEKDVKLLFALNNALFDASIVSWDNKISFDSSRPITVVRTLFNGQQVRAWGGPGRGTRTIDGGDWLPYQAANFPTPPFAEYTSGHSTFSAAAADVLRSFTGSDHFGDSVTVKAGSSKVEPNSPATDVVLSWPTFSDAAVEAGLSRRLGGIHFELADTDGRSGGQRCASMVLDKVRGLYAGSTDPASQTSG